MELSKILKRDNNNIDLLRLLAALFVAWSHAPLLFGVKMIMPPLPLCVNTGELGVSFFFFLSGMLVTNSLITKKNPVSFVLSRFMRIYPAFFVTLLVLVFIVGPIFTEKSLIGYFNSHETWHFFLNNARLRTQFVISSVWQDRLYTSIDASLWTIPVEVCCYVALLFSFLLCRYFKLKPWMFLLPACIISLLPIEHILYLIGKDFTIVNPVHIFCFTIGTAMSLHKESIHITRTTIIIALVVCVITWRWTNVIRYLFPIVVSIILLYATSTSPLVNIRPKHDISYGIYLWHWPIYQVLFTYISGVGPYLFFAICIIITTGIAYLSAVFIEEPCLRFGRRISVQKYINKNNSILIILMLIAVCVIAKTLF